MPLFSSQYHFSYIKVDNIMWTMWNQQFFWVLIYLMSHFAREDTTHLQSLNLKKLRTKKQVTCSLLQKLPFHEINVAPTPAPCSLHTSKSLQAACKMFLTHKSVSLAKLNEKRFIIQLPALLGFDDFFCINEEENPGLIIVC